MRPLMYPAMALIPFRKMHGLGNDFVVLDGRALDLPLTTVQVRALADRHTGIGCDQLILIVPASMPGADAGMRIFNADGGEVAACGNAARCIASLLIGERGRPITLETSAGTIHAAAAGPDRITVDMGPVRFAWQDIPLREPVDTRCLPIVCGALHSGVAVNVGNPHAVFFVDRVDTVPLAEIGPQIEHDPLFPERTNVEIVERLGSDRLRVRVWERGVGLTRACGTGACAVVAAAADRGLTGRQVTVELDGGSLEIDWRGDGHIAMTGPALTSFTGRVEIGFPVTSESR